MARSHTGVGVPPLELAAVSVQLLDFGNTQYSGSVGLGTPPQLARVLMDTGSSDLWVRAGAFELNRSATGRELGSDDVAITYGQGSVVGPVVEDVLRIGGANLSGQRLLLPRVERGMSSVEADGVLGLALPGLSHTGETVLQHLQREASISVFTLLLTGTEVGSYLVLGMPEPSWYSVASFVWTPAVTGLWWALEGALVVQDAGLQVYGTFLLDSGTSYIAAPSSMYPTLVDAILPGGAKDRCALERPVDIYICPCEVLHMARPLEVHVAGTSFPIQPNKLFGQISGEEEACVLQVMRLQDGLPLILGDTFLRTVAAVFDVGGQRIGLARRSAEGPGGGPSEAAECLRLWLLLSVLICLFGLLALLARRLWRCGPAAAVEGEDRHYRQL